jgi:OOP family OmpA-OmpF porin
MGCNPWRWLWGIIPIAMLTWLAFTWEQEGIETDLRSRAEVALEKAGFGWGEVSLDGRDAHLSGVAPDDASPYRATQTVRNVWGVRVVRARTDSGAAAGKRQAPAPVAVEEAPAMRDARPSATEIAPVEPDRAELERTWREAEEQEKRWRAEGVTAKQPEAPAAVEEQTEVTPAQPPAETYDRAELERRWREAEEHERRWKSERETSAADAERVRAKAAEDEAEKAKAAEAEAEAARQAEAARAAEAKAAELRAAEDAERARAAEEQARQAEEAKQQEAAKRQQDEAEAQRKAEEDAARQKEEDAREQAAAEAEAQRLADEEAKRLAEQEAAEEAKRKADAEAAEEEKRKREAAEAEQRRKDEVALAARKQQEDADAKKQAEADRCQGLMRSAMAEGVINFAKAKADLTKDSYLTLDRLAGIVKACPAARINIAGHTDSEGLEERNQALSERRAGTVASYLASKGVETNRLSTVGYGESRPIAPNDTPEGMLQNRRIEFNVTPQQ